MVRWPIAAIDAGTCAVDRSLLNYVPGHGLHGAGRHDDHGEQYVLLPVTPW
jgi:hypothetical protein